MPIDKMVPARRRVSAVPLLRLAIWLLFGLLTAFGVVGPAHADCPIPNAPPGTSGQAPDLKIDQPCYLRTDSNYYYGQINIVSGGALIFTEPDAANTGIAFWANSIIVEANGVLSIGSPVKPYGANGGFLTIYLYGKDQSNGQDPAQNQGQAVLCKTTITDSTGPCGIPSSVWTDNGKSLIPGCGQNAGPGQPGQQRKCIPGLPSTVSDYFYQYGPLHGDGLCTNRAVFNNGKCGPDPADGLVGYFGYKTLAVSYDGSMYIYGYKGANYDPVVDADPTNSGYSWLRLSGDLTPGATPDAPSLTLDTPGLGGKWFQSGERIASQFVVTTTDYLPGHSELLTIKSVGTDGRTVNLLSDAAQLHVGTRFPIGKRIGPDVQKRLQESGMDKDLIDNGAETRAAAALLTRSVRIVSASDTLDPKVPFSGYFGGHTIFRQGFRAIQVQGVEFANLGQGGKMGHYPIHFHKSRQVPPGTYVKDSSVNVSNTRWYVLHSTQGVTLQRNVGWQSIGHGYYLEDGTETDNNFYSNIGIFARAAVQNDQNPRGVPGILSNNVAYLGESGAFSVRTGSDSHHPTVFWITNGWNNFVGNMAAGAGACGSAYWLVPMMNSDRPDVPTPDNIVGLNPQDAHMKWDYDVAGHFGYAGLQTERDPTYPFDTTYGGDTPLGVFYKNSATATMMSFQTTIDAPNCSGFTVADEKSDFPTVPAIKSFAPPAINADDPNKRDTPESILPDTYYPHIFGKKAATVCPVLDPSKPPGPNNYNCGYFANGSFSNQVTDCSVATEQNCTVTVLDHFTSSFTWADGAVAAVWLRPSWYLVDNSVITDVQNGGLNFVTGGDMTHSSLVPGYWAVAKSSIFVGHTQPQKGEAGYQTYHAFAADIGPINSDSKLSCDPLKPGKPAPNTYCINSEEGVSFQLADFFVNQSLFRIYDGPTYQDGNAFLDITRSSCAVTGYNSGCIYGNELLKGIPKSVINDDPKNHDCYLPNAAIAWKQPNGFFYPPAFHSRNLFFDNVDIRHFVINPLFSPTQDATNNFGQGGSYITDEKRVDKYYCNFNSSANESTPGSFAGFTGIDRQTELNDDDGTLTGLSNTFPASLPPVVNLNQTISINEDSFFGAPVETPECASNISNTDGANNLPANACKPTQNTAPPVTARTSPYDYVATVIYHPADANWSTDCTNPTCYGVPLYRQYLNGADGGQPNGDGSSREWSQWDDVKNLSQIWAVAPALVKLALRDDRRSQFHKEPPWKRITEGPT